MIHVLPVMSRGCSAISADETVHGITDLAGTDRCSTSSWPAGQRFNRSPPGLSMTTISTVPSSMECSPKACTAPEGTLLKPAVPMQQNPPRSPPIACSKEVTLLGEDEPEVDRDLESEYFAAIRCTSEEINLKALRAAGSNLVNKADSDMMTILHYAAKHGSVRLCREILARPDFVSCRAFDAQGNTAMHIATLQGRCEVLQALLDHDPCLAVVPNRGGQTSAELAMRRASSEGVEEVFRQCQERRRA